MLTSSLLASLALTLVLNVLIRAFPGTSADARARQFFGEDTGRPDELPAADEKPRLRIFFPWRQMLMWSLGITLLINILRFF